MQLRKILVVQSEISIQKIKLLPAKCPNWNIWRGVISIDFYPPHPATPRQRVSRKREPKLSPTR